MTLADDLPRALACWRAGDCVETERLCRALLAEHPDHPMILSVLALALHGQGKHAAALDLGRQTIARLPLSAHLYHNAGVYLTALDRVQEAAPYFQQAVALAPTLAPGAPTPCWRECGDGALDLDLGFTADESHARAAKPVHPHLAPPRR